MVVDTAEVVPPVSFAFLHATSHSQDVTGNLNQSQWHHRHKALNTLLKDEHHFLNFLSLWKPSTNNLVYITGCGWESSTSLAWTVVKNKLNSLYSLNTFLMQTPQSSCSSSAPSSQATTLLLSSVERTPKPMVDILNLRCTISGQASSYFTQD